MHPCEIRRGETIGAGSHPKLTGREHIYQDDAILGVKRAEVKRKYV